jgi:hypothetical protein
VAADLLDRLGAVGHLADHGDVLLDIQQHLEAGAHQRLVVGEQDLDRPVPPRFRQSLAPVHGEAACSGGSGRRARTWKPPPGRGPAVSSPPSSAARSRMPTMPWPPSVP